MSIYAYLSNCVEERNISISAQQWRALAVLSEDYSWGTKGLAGELTTSCNSNSRGTDTFASLLRHMHSGTHIHTYNLNLKINNFNAQFSMLCFQCPATNLQSSCALQNQSCMTFKNNSHFISSARPVNYWLIVSLDLMTVNLSYKWNHTVFTFVEIDLL